MNHAVMRRMQAANGDGSMGALNPTLANLGYFEDSAGNIYYPDGLIMSGPAVSAMSRGLTTRSAVPVTVNPPVQLVTLPNGQQITAAQYQQLLAQQGQQQLISGGVTQTGLQLGNTNISWTMIAVLGLGLVLLQSRPLSRKGQ